MKKLSFFIFLLTLLSACGYRGGLYLPKEGDKARFGVVQTYSESETPSPSHLPTKEQTVKE